MSQALEGIRILDFTHVQSGPTCTQLLAWFGADVIKVERAGEGDATRGQLRDIPGVDSLYFTMLNHNKRSITLDAKRPAGKEVLETLIRDCDNWNAALESDPVVKLLELGAYRRLQTRARNTLSSS